MCFGPCRRCLVGSGRGSSLPKLVARILMLFTEKTMKATQHYSDTKLTIRT